MKDSRGGQLVILGSIAVMIMTVLISFIFLVPQTDPASNAITSTTTLESRTEVGTSTKDGVVQIERPQSGHLMFEPGALKLKNEASAVNLNLYNFKNIGGEAEWFSRPAYVAETLYVILNDGKLYRFNRDYNFEKIPIEITHDEYVSDYLVIGSQIYYLAGPYCDEYLGKCNSALRIYDKSTGISKTLAKNIQSGDIAGFTNDKSRLYLAKYFGDGGCFASQFSVYDFTTTELVINELVYNGCEGDGGDTQWNAQNKLLDSLYPKRKTVEALRFEGNIILPDEQYDSGDTYVDPITTY